MTFGFSIGDFIAIGTLALNLYASYRDAPSEIREVSCELLSLHTTLEALRHELEDPKSTISHASSKKTENLQGLILRCKEPLKELEAIYKKYEVMGSWRRMKIGKEDINCIRHKLGVHLSGIALFLTGFSHEALARMERKLEVLGRLEAKVDQLCAEIRAPHGENDSHSMLETLCKRDQSEARGPNSDNLELVVYALGNYGGVSPEDVSENSTFVNTLVNWHWDAEVRDAQKKRIRKTRQNLRRKGITSISSVTVSSKPPDGYLSMGEMKTPGRGRRDREQREALQKERQDIQQERERERRTREKREQESRWEMKRQRELESEPPRKVKSSPNHSRHGNDFYSWLTQKKRGSELCPCGRPCHK